MSVGLEVAVAGLPGQTSVALADRDPTQNEV